MKTNILVQYQGGGYDGCFWEWNYFYIDKQGTFHNIQSSGRAGIDNKQDAEQLLESDDTHYVYDLDNKQDIETFSRECNAVHITGVLQWFEDNPDTGVEFFAVCSACEGHIVSCDDITLENWHGCGGIMSTADTLICQECYCIGECPCCESYVGDTELKSVNPDEHHDYDFICADCKEDYDNERETEDFEDLRWQSFCTGSPDMFDLESAEPEIDSHIEYAGQQVFSY